MINAEVYKKISQTKIPRRFKSISNTSDVLPSEVLEPTDLSKVVSSGLIGEDFHGNGNDYGHIEY